MLNNAAEFLLELFKTDIDEEVKLLLFLLKDLFKLVSFSKSVFIVILFALFGGFYIFNNFKSIKEELSWYFPSLFFNDFNYFSLWAFIF